MSGGVDSGVAALLMKESGYDCIGVTMKLFKNEDAGITSEKSCCSAEDAETARSVAFAVGIPHFVFNFSERFKHDVIDRFVAAYECGRTPNPCVDCNRYLKFDALYRRTKELERDFVVTGHYARIEHDPSGRTLLKKAIDPDKDQSYVLYSMTKEQLEHTIFPLGGMTKSQVRKIAAEHGFINAKKHDSQDICFVQNGRYAEFIENYTGKKWPDGDFIDQNGNVLGRHHGIIRYTVGQRRGLGLSLPEPLYVCSVNKDDNTVTLGRECDLYSKVLRASDINLIAADTLDRPVKLTAKVRYRQKEKSATVTQTDENSLLVEFDEPQRAITPGQSVVLYDGDTVVGGGTIV